MIGAFLLTLRVWLVLKLSLCPSFKSFVMNFLAWRRNSTEDLNESQI
nr:MAG TPA: hypothetical protein [Caudoviricetes sp.]